MNNNRNNNNNNSNRRRGRGNRQQQGGGGNQNRIDSRSRGNAPQMLDKYKKLAQDAAHNGDRVQAEYYLQFADHYFRVIADNKSRMDEQRGGARRDEREDEEVEEFDEFDIGGRQQPVRSERDRGNDQPRGERPGDPRGDRSAEPRGDRGNDQARGDRGPDSRRPRTNRRDADDGNSRPVFTEDGERGTDFEPAENPFTRDNRGRERDTGGDDGNRRPRSRRGNGRDRDEQPVSDGGEIDAAALPPSFSASIPATPDDGGEAEPVARRKLPPRRRKPVAAEGDDSDTAKVVN